MRNQTEGPAKTGEAKFNHGPVVAAILTLLLAAFLILSLGQPAREARVAFRDCLRRSDLTLREQVGKCSRDLKGNKRQRNSCINKARAQKARSDNTCRKLLVETKAFSEPIVKPIFSTCVANSASSWKSCGAKVSEGQANAIEVVGQFLCSGANTCAADISNVQGPVVIIGKSGTSPKIIRMDSYNYPLLNIANSNNIVLMNMEFDELYLNSCPDCSSPSIQVANSSNIKIDNIQIRGSKSTSLLLKTVGSVRIGDSRFFDGYADGIAIPYTSSDKEISSRIEIVKNEFRNFRRSAIDFAAQGLVTSRSSVNSNIFINSSVGLVLRDPSRFIDITSNFFSNESGLGIGHGIQAFSEVDSIPNFISDLTIKDNTFENLAGWAVIRSSEKAPPCRNILIVSNPIYSVKCGGNPQCSSLGGVLWDCYANIFLEARPAELYSCGPDALISNILFKNGSAQPLTLQCDEASPINLNPGREISFPISIPFERTVRCETNSIPAKSITIPHRKSDVDCVVGPTVTPTNSATATPTKTATAEVTPNPEFMVSPSYLELCPGESAAVKIQVSKALHAVEVSRGSFVLGFILPGGSYSDTITFNSGGSTISYFATLRTPNGPISLGTRSIEVRKRSNCDPNKCPLPQELCGVNCKDLKSDVNNCGGCGNQCSVPNGSPKCVNGSCAVDACNFGFTKSADGKSCVPIQCPSPQRLCGVDCKDPTNDVNNCGGCGNQCSVPNGSPKCVNGSCAVDACNFGFTKSADGKSCVPIQCPSPQQLCGVDCKDPTNDVNNCGGCYRTCSVANGVPKCSNGTCQVDYCLNGYSKSPDGTSCSPPTCNNTQIIEAISQCTNGKITRTFSAPSTCLNPASNSGVTLECPSGDGWYSVSQSCGGDVCTSVCEKSCYLPPPLPSPSCQDQVEYGSLTCDYNSQLMVQRVRYPSGCSYQVTCPNGMFSYGESCAGSYCEIECRGGSCDYY